MELAKPLDGKNYNTSLQNVLSYALYIDNIVYF